MCNLINIRVKISYCSTKLFNLLLLLFNVPRPLDIIDKILISLMVMTLWLPPVFVACANKPILNCWTRLPLNSSCCHFDLLRPAFIQIASSSTSSVVSTILIAVMPSLSVTLLPRLWCFWLRNMLQGQALVHLLLADMFLSWQYCQLCMSGIPPAPLYLRLSSDPLPIFLTLVILHLR